MYRVLLLIAEFSVDLEMSFTLDKVKSAFSVASNKMYSQLKINWALTFCVCVCVCVCDDTVFFCIVLYELERGISLLRGFL
jgi:hypothetical protein